MDGKADNQIRDGVDDDATINLKLMEYIVRQVRRNAFRRLQIAASPSV